MSLDDLPVEKLDDDMFKAEPDPAVLAAEKAEADRVRALGPEPHPEITAEMHENNPSNYTPPPADATTVVPNPSVTVIPQEVRTGEEDHRQRWICISDTGIRTGHPAFRSDAHLLGQMVHCPTCEGISVRKVGDDEVLTESAVTP